MSDKERNNLAIAINADGKLWEGHFGMAPIYWIYDPQGNLLDKRTNPYGVQPGKKSEHHDNPQLITALLFDCKVFIGKRMGKESQRKLAENMVVEPFLVDVTTPAEAIFLYLNKKS